MDSWQNVRRGVYGWISSNKTDTNYDKPCVSNFGYVVHSDKYKGG